MEENTEGRFKRLVKKARKAVSAVGRVAKKGGATVLSWFTKPVAKVSSWLYVAMVLLANVVLWLVALPATGINYVDDRVRWWKQEFHPDDDFETFKDFRYERVCLRLQQNTVAYNWLRHPVTMWKVRREDREDEEGGGETEVTFIPEEFYEPTGEEPVDQSEYPVVFDPENLTDDPYTHDWAQYGEDPSVADAYKVLAHSGGKPQYSYWMARAFVRTAGDPEWSINKNMALFLSKVDKREIIPSQARLGIKDEMSLSKKVQVSQES